MKTNNFILAMSVFLTSSVASAEIIINLPAKTDISIVPYYTIPINQYASAQNRSDRGIVLDSISIKKDKGVIAIPENNDNYQFELAIGNDEMSVYASPGETITISVNSVNPLTYTLSGNQLAIDQNKLNKDLFSFMEKVKSLSPESMSDDAVMQDIQNQYVAIQKNFIASNPNSPAAAIALMNLDGQDFLGIYENLPIGVRNSILMPLVEKQYQTELRNIEMAKTQKELEAGAAEAPAFTLKNLEDQDVSLSDFKGKWVILDFWGSWCPWCIKGFPELKKAYKEFSPRLEIIGIDCNESEAEWKAGVKKYDLPWVNVYNPAGSNLTADYGVQGFPTKAIIDPQGRVRNITVGHDPAFFEILSGLMNE